jgi:hypothetical protein
MLVRLLVQTQSFAFHRLVAFSLPCGSNRNVAISGQTEGWRQTCWHSSHGGTRERP